MSAILQVLPLPNTAKLTDVNTSISGIVYDNNNPNYTPNGTYVATSSSYASNKNKAYNIFNGITTKPWICDFANNPDYNENTFANPAYTRNPYSGETPSPYRGGGNVKTKYTTVIGSGYNATNHYGEWVQIQLPYKVYLYRYSILTPELPNGFNSFPKKFILVGSNDGERWEIVHMRDYKTVPRCNGSPILYNLNTINNYSYYRLVILEMADRQTLASISQWNLFGTIRQTTNRETFSNITENFYGGNRLMEGATTISSPDISIGGPYAGKYITEKCADENGNSVFQDYESSVAALRRTYPKCQGLTAETKNQKLIPPSNCAIMTMPGLVSTTDAKVGNGSLVLEGTPDQYVTLPPITTTTTGTTIALWFKSDGNKTWARLFDIGNGAGNNNILIAINDNKLLAWTPHEWKWVSNTNLNNNTWHHVAWTMSAGDSYTRGTWKFYIDGSLVNSTSGVLPAAVVRSKAYIGKSNWDWDPYLRGKISEFRMYQSELSASDVANIFKFPNLSGYGDPYNSAYDAIKDPYMYYSFDISTVTNGTGVNSVNSPIIKKSTQYTLRKTTTLMNYSNTGLGAIVNSVNGRGDNVQSWTDNVSSWTTSKGSPVVSESFYTIADISNTQLGPLRAANTNYNALLAKINKRYQDISGGVNKITNTQGSGIRDIMMSDDKYDYTGTSSAILHKKPVLQDGMKDDSILMLSQQNSVFILGTICSTALLILAISLAKA